MSERRFRPVFLGSVLFLVLGAANLQAQYAKPPDTYSITNVDWMTVNGTSMKQTINTYGDGSKMMKELVMPPNAKVPKGVHTRSLYDLQSHKSMDWDVQNANIPCTPGTFSGDWADDPFKWLSGLFGPDLSPFHPQQLGTETVAGMTAKVMELTGPNGEKIKIWVDQKYGLLLKSGAIDKSGQFSPDMEVTQVSFSKPPASVFVVPARCGDGK